MRRRAILIAAGAGLLAGGPLVRAQALQKIVFVHPGTKRGNGSNFDAFRSSLATLGYVDGRNVAIDSYWAEDRTERLDSIAAQTVAGKPAVIVTSSSSAIRAFKNATASIPIVFATGSSPVEQGFVASLRQPGGNITGVIFHQDLEGKIVEIVREALPSARRLGVLLHERDAMHRIHLASIETAARRLGFEVVPARVAGAEDFGRAFDELTARRAEALVLPSLVLFSSRMDRLAPLAAKTRIPIFAAHSSGAEAGGLVSYGTLTEENYRRAAALVHKILRGATPGELPVEQPERIQLVINLKTARAIGVRLPREFVQRADKVID